MKPTTIVCCGTGPSITQQQVDIARTKGRLFVCNNAYQLARDAELLYACNLEWWDHYIKEVQFLPCEKWTSNREAANRYGINCIAEKRDTGLSMDRNVIHHGEGSGYSLVSMAWRAGAERIVLLGYDLHYAADYDGRAKKIGSTPRHFFGEYNKTMQHWPSVMVKDGVHFGLVDLYRSIAKQNVVEVINCTPDSSIDCFPKVSIDAL